MFFQKRELEPLPAVIEPEVPKNEREYLKRVQAESRAVLDAPLEAFEVVTQQPGWTVLRKPVAGTKVCACSVRARADTCCCISCPCSFSVHHPPV